MALVKKVALPLYIELEQRDALKLLSESTRVPQQVYLREAIDDLLNKYATEIRRAQK